MAKENTYLLLFCQTVTNLTFYLRRMPHGEFALNPLLLFVKASLFLLVKSFPQRLRSSADDPSVSVPCPVVINKFKPVTSFSLQEIDDHLKPFGSLNDAVPSYLFREVFPTVGPSVLAVVNSSLSSGVVPKCLKHAVVQVLLKKNWIPQLMQTTDLSLNCKI